MRFSYRRGGESQNVYNGIRRDANSTFGNRSHLVKLFLGLRTSHQSRDCVTNGMTGGSRTAWVMGCAGFG
nr:hypothetical protein [Tanacetum cinerariifolium]